MDLFIIVGKTMKDILPGYYRLTGTPAVPPKWSFGIWMSKISYGTRKEVERVAAKLREYELPCDVIHIDTDWFAENRVCDWKFDEEKFPDVQSMIHQLHREGYKISLWQLPYIERGKLSYEVYEEGARKGYFASNPGGDMQFPHGLIDFTNPEAGKWTKFDTDCIVDGGRWIKEVVPLNTMPVYARENAIIPMGPAMNYIGEKEETPYEFHCYPADGENHMVLYEPRFEIWLKAEKSKVTVILLGQSEEELL